MTKGQRANKRGKWLENSVAELLDEEYEKVSSQHFFALRSLKQPIYTRQCHIGKCIYGKNHTVDFILYHPIRWQDCLVIQCKWQAVGGSIDEKFPYAVMSIQLNEFETIIVLDGSGYSKGAGDWLRGQAGKNKLRHVLSYAELQKFQSQGRI